MNYDTRVQANAQCTVERTVAVIGGKWTTLILRELLSGTKRFGEMRSSLTGISPKTLTDRLRDLEERGVLERKIYPEVPPRVEYSLTERGQALRPIIEAMGAWGSRWT
ncbi:MAG: helix-turn-helix transcriptional regulator [Deinococcota bacterium]|jgi:DNA-binding HxlR family transcriptional regulator|nr:helix-turn-helix transcriptional regulator [Deinococcota bacterium]